MHAIDLTTNSTRMPNHERLTLIFTSTPQFSAPPCNIHEAMHSLYPLTPSSLPTTNETRGIHNPQFYPHAIPYNRTLLQLYMRETDYEFQIPALDHTEDHQNSRVTKATNPYDYLFRNNPNFMHFQFNFIKPNNLESVNLHTSISSLDKILSSRKLHQFSYENFNSHHTLHTSKKHIFISNKFSSPFCPIEPPLNTHSLPPNYRAVSVIMTSQRIFHLLFRD